MPRRFAWLLFAVAAVFEFLATLHMSGVGGLANWFLPAGLCALCVAGVMWTMPQPGVPNP